MATYYVDGAVGNDTNAGTSAGAGNAWATLGKAATTMADGDTCYVKASATYTLTATVTLNNTVTFIGYTSVVGDNGLASVTTATNSTPLFTLNAYKNFTFVNFDMTNTAGTKAAGVTTSANGATLEFKNCLLHGCQTGYDTLGGMDTIRLYDCGVYNNVSHGCSSVNPAVVEVSGCFIYGNGTGGTGTGLYMGRNSGLIVQDSVVSGNATGGINNRYTYGAVNTVISNCTISNNGTGDGIRDVSTTFTRFDVSNCIIRGNGAYGINLTACTSLTPTNCRIRTNAFGTNTSGNYNSNVPAGVGEITLTVSPFTNAAAGDFSLNNTAGGGALCRVAGFPGAFPGGLTTGYKDVGGVQHQDSGGSNVAMAFIRRGGLAARL